MTTATRSSEPLGAVPKPPTRTVRLSATIEPDLYAQFARLAYEDRRTISALIHALIADFVAEKNAEKTSAPH